MRKKIIISLLAIPLLIGSYLVINTAYSFHKANRYIVESKQYSASGNYKSALISLSEAKALNLVGDIATEIDSEINRNNQLLQSQDYFNQGKVYYDEGEYELALRYFKLVSRDDANYSASKTYIELAERKLAGNQKGSVAGVSTQNQPQPLVAPTIFAPNKVENLEALCEADVSSFKSKAALKFDQMIRQSIKDHQDTYNDPNWGPLTDAKFADMKKQYDANINNVVDQMEIWCLEHNRDYSGFKAPEVKYVF